MPRGLAHIVQRATSAHPEDRYQTLGELLDALRYYQLSKDPTRNAREALENLVLQAEDLLRRHEYKAENLKAILGLLLHLDLDRLGPRTVIEFFDRLPREILPVLAGEFAGEFLPPLRAYAGAIQSRVAGFNFAYADAVARRMQRVRPLPQPRDQDHGLTGDVNNCGACGVRCNVSAGQFCQGNGCCTRNPDGSVVCSGMVCPGGQTNCGGTCVDTRTSASNCGACFIQCGPGSVCSAGNCSGW